MHKFIIIGAIAVSLIGCSNREAEGRAEFIAAGIDAIAPKSLGDGLTITAARAEQSTLILSFEGVSAEEMALPDFDRQMQAAVCADPGFRKVTNDGVEIVLDLAADNSDKATVKVTSC